MTTTDNHQQKNTSKTKRRISRKPKFIPDDNRIIRFGKFKGKKVKALLQADDDYLRFLLTTEDTFATWEKKYLKHHGVELESDTSSDSGSDSDE